MPSFDGLADQVIAILRRFSARREIALDQTIVGDIGINGSDVVELITELEKRFGVDLDPLIQSQTRYVPPRWWDPSVGQDHGPSNGHLTVRSLIGYIAANGDGASPNVC